MTKRSTPIPWARYSTDQVEDLIAALLLRLHPNASRMDGAGGDDGIDVLLPVEGGIHVFEIKSYSTRLTAKQKTAVKKSLTTAVKNSDLRAWTLVLPLDHSPAERRWMNNVLAKLTSVPLTWMGLSRLEVELATHRDLIRAYAPGAVEDQAFSLLAEYNQYEAIPPRSAGELVERAQRLQEQAAAVDPCFDFGIDVQSESITLSLTPKNEHAPQISGNISLTAAPGTAEDAAIEEFMTYGRPLTLDASNIAAFEVDVPFSVQDLIPAESSPEQIIIGPAAGSEPMRQLARIDAVNGAGRVLGSLAVTFTEASEGPRGGLYRAGHDRSGFLRMAIKVSPDRSGGQIEYQSEFMDDLLPADVLPSLRFLDAMRRSSMLRLVANGSTTPIRIPDAASRMARIENLLHMAEAFDRISQTVGIVLPLPKRWSDDDATNVTFYDRLLREGTAPYPPADFHFTMPAEQARALLGRGPLPRLTMTGQGDRMPELLGHELPLPGKMEFESQGLLVANLPHLATQCAADPPPDTVDVVLVSDLTTTSVFRIVPDTEQ